MLWFGREVYISTYRGFPNSREARYWGPPRPIRYVESFGRPSLIPMCSKRVLIRRASLQQPYGLVARRVTYFRYWLAFVSKVRRHKCNPFVDSSPYPSSTEQLITVVDPPKRRGIYLYRFEILESTATSINCELISWSSKAADWYLGATPSWLFSPDTDEAKIVVAARGSFAIFENSTKTDSNTRLLRQMSTMDRLKERVFPVELSHTTIMIMLSYACRNQRDETFTFRRQGKEKTLAPTVSQDDWTFVGTDEVEVCYTRQEYNDEANLCLESYAAHQKPRFKRW